VLAVDEGSGWPYAVPLSYVLMDGALYFHCALDGRKIDAMRANSRVCFTVTGETEAVYDGGFSTCFESVIVQGRAMPVEDPDEKYRGLCGLAKKYLPADMDKADGDIRSSYERTALYRVSLDRISGKAKRKK
jgi:nitroimidazol reductase NimA-like FMN-containing flavoprotein (pyridoxamine 5'-phosphate oxidase superfamily)